LRMVKPSMQAVRKDEVNLTRLTRRHLLRGGPAPVCTHCGGPLTVARVLVDCPRYAEARLICHLDGVIADILGDNPCRVSNVACHVHLTDTFFTPFSNFSAFYDFSESP
jgi:hypothetical protein